MNYNRPQLQKLDIWIRFDSYLPPDRRAGYETQATSKASKTSGFLDRHLHSYEGDEPKLVAIRDKYLAGERLTSREIGVAGERFKFLDRVEACRNQLIRRGGASSAELHRLDSPTYSYPELELLEQRLGL
jgi:hypothetical protein